MSIGMLQGPPDESNTNQPAAAAGGSSSSRGRVNKQAAANSAAGFGSASSSSAIAGGDGPAVSEVITQAAGTTIKVISGGGQGSPNSAGGQQQPQVTIISILPGGSNAPEVHTMPLWGSPSASRPMPSQQQLQRHQQQQQPAAEVVFLPPVGDLQPGDLSAPAAAGDPDVVTVPAAGNPPSQPKLEQRQQQLQRREFFTEAPTSGKQQPAGGLHVESSLQGAH